MGIGYRRKKRWKSDTKQTHEKGCREEEKTALTLSSCRHANSSSWFTGSLSITGFDMDLTEDSIISAPYYRRVEHRGGQFLIMDLIRLIDTDLDNPRAGFGMFIDPQSRIYKREVRNP